MNKQEIIDEIRRTAEENDGVVLGRQKFSKLTGIRESDWYGIFWASWGEALVEAGFQPNEFNAAYDETWLIKSFMRIIREVGAWPSEGRLRLICRNNSDLPNGNTFRVRLGNKADIAIAILEHIQGQEGFDDITAIVEPIIEPEMIDSDIDEIITEESFGFVYLMKFAKYHKIGHSNAVGRRQYELGTKLPEEIITVHSIKTDDPEGVERYWHNRFKDKRREGEWFELNEADIKSFKRWRRIF